MAITDQTATARPPEFHVHKYDSKVDTVDDLNAWAIGLWSPLYSDRNPAFQEDGTGLLHANMGGTFTTLVPDGFWIIFSLNGVISLQADNTFQSNYALSE